MEVTLNTTSLNNLAPGVYVNEIDLSQKRRETEFLRDNVLVLGNFDMGEVETPIIVKNLNEFERMFGKINKFNQISWLGVRSLLKYDVNAIVVRLNSSNHRNANFNFGTTNNKVVLNKKDFNNKYPTLVADSLPNKLSVVAKNPGSWGNSIGVVVKIPTQDLNYIAENLVIEVPYNSATEDIFDRRLRTVNTFNITDDVSSPSNSLSGVLIYYEKDTINSLYKLHVKVNYTSTITSVNDLDSTSNGGNNNSNVQLVINELSPVSPIVLALSSFTSVTAPTINLGDTIYNERDIKTKVILLSPPSGAAIRVRHGLFSGNNSYFYKIVSSVKYYYKPTVVDFDYLVPFAKDSSGNNIKWSSIVRDFPYSTHYGRKNKKEGDIISLLVIDVDGKISGSAGKILESYVNYSCLEDSVTQYNEPIEIIKTVNENSKYIYLVKKSSTDLYEDFDTLSDYISGVQLINGVDAFTSTSLGYTLYDNLNDLQNVYKKIISELNFNVDYILPYVNILSINDPGMATYEVGAYEDLINFLITDICEKNKEHVLIFSPPPGYVIDNPNAITNTVRFRNNILDSTYSFMVMQWLFDYEPRSRSYYWIPSHFDVAGIFVRNRRLSNNYLPPAGYERGNLIGKMVLSNNLDKNERDFLYQNQINFIIDSPQDGLVLFGDKSLTTLNSIFNRINVRLIVIEIRKNVMNLLKPYLFGVNNAYTRSLIVTDIVRYLNFVKDNGGLFDFSVICDESNNTPEIISNNMLVVDLNLKPTQSVNYIVLNIITNRLEEEATITINE